MGGQASSESPSGLVESADGLIINSLIIKEVITLTYEDFVQKVKDMNEISKTFDDSSGTHLIFIIKKGSDATILWKNTVRIGCIRVEDETRKITSHRFLKLRQFLRLYTLLSNYVNASMANHEASTSSGIPISLGKNNEQTQIKQIDDVQSSIPRKSHKDITASFIMRNVNELGEEGSDLVECCICMERKPDVTMPCTHSYCLPCIEQWNVTHKTCPICREEVTTDDSWVISEAPPSEEVDEEVRKALASVIK